MVEVWPPEVGFAQGEGGQTSFSLYLHGSPDGGHELYTASPFDPAIWEGDDAGIGRQGADAGKSFAGHLRDDAGTGGPYSTRLASLVLRPQPFPNRRYRAQLKFAFNGAGSGERVALLLRCATEGETVWDTRGTDGLKNPHFYTSLTQGILVVVEQAGFARVYEYDATGARTLLQSASATITGATQTLTVEVSDADSPVITVSLDAADIFGGTVASTEDASTRGHVGFCLTNTTGSNYPSVTELQIEDMVPTVPVILLRDEFARLPLTTQTIDPQAADGRATVDKLPHKDYEWGGHRISLETAVDIGPRLEGGALVYGPDIGATQITTNTLHDFINLRLDTSGSADQFAAIEWSFQTRDANWMTARTAVGIALRSNKLADGDPPTGNGAAGYLLRAVFATPEPFFELLKLGGASPARIGATRPFDFFAFLPNQHHIFTFEVVTTGGDVFLSAKWIKPTGEVIKLYVLEEDTLTTPILAAAGVGHHVSWQSMGGQNLRVLIHRFSRASLLINLPTLGGEAILAGASPSAPSFIQPTLRRYQTIQEHKERGYVASRPNFAVARTSYEATWVLNKADFDIQIAFLQARATDRAAFSIVLEDGAVNFILAETEYDFEQATPDLFRIGPVALIEVL